MENCIPYLLLLIVTGSPGIAFADSSNFIHEIACYKDLDGQEEYTSKFNRAVSPITFPGVNDLVVVPFKENQFLFITSDGIYLQDFPEFAPNDYVWDSSEEVRQNEHKVVDETFKSTNKKLFLLKLPLAGRLRISWNKEKKGSSIRGRLSVESADFVPKMNPPMTAAQLNRSAGVIDTNDMITPEIKDFILKDLSRRIQMADTKRYRPLMAGTRTVRVPFQNCLGVLALRPLVESVLKDRFHIDPNAALSQPATYSDTDLHLSQPAK